MIVRHICSTTKWAKFQLYQTFSTAVYPVSHPTSPSLVFPCLRRHSLSCTKLLSPHSSGEGEEEKTETQLAMVNRESVRRGALILFCDYVVRLLRMLENTNLF